MKDLVAIAAFGATVLLLTWAIDSGVWLTFLMMTLYAALLAQAWNLLGGYGGQFSFGHALFFGVGAYAQVILQVTHGVNAWLAFALAMAAAAAVALGVGALSFRYGLKGSYFALVTLAFAEVFRILAVSVGFTGGGVGMMLPLHEGVAQLGSRRSNIVLVLALVVAALLVTSWLRHSRFGARLQALRDNEDAARAVGVDVFATKLGAIVLSGAFMGGGGAFYVQVFHYIDPALAFGAHTSVEALVGAIVGGMGTLWGPLLGAALLHLLGEATRNLFGQLPGLNLVIYGVVLVLIVMFMPRGVAGIGQDVRERWRATKGGR